MIETTDYFCFCKAKADEGIAWAQTRIGDLYYLGIGMPEDAQEDSADTENRLKEAVKWYRKSEAQGDARGQYSLARAYSFGEGVRQDHKKAADLYRKSAEQDDTDAQYALGRAYYFGKGVAQNKAAAAEWYGKAGDGHPFALLCYAKMLMEGDGIEQDYATALTIYSLVRSVWRDRTDIWRKAQIEMDKHTWEDYLSPRQIHESHNQYPRIAAAGEGLIHDISWIGDRVAVRKTGADIKHLTGEDVFAKIWRSVVFVRTGVSTGSGVIVLPSIVATCGHVVEDDASNIVVSKAVTREGEWGFPLGARMPANANNADICWLYVEHLCGLPARLRRYEDLKVGEPVYALGTPKEEPLWLSPGIISQKREGHIYTNAPISPGSSGGGLFDAEGNLIGLTMGGHAETSVVQNLNIAVSVDYFLDEKFPNNQ